MSHRAQVDLVSSEQAMKRLRQMYAKPEHPYYIMAPDYRETSSGIASLHYLCHLLNLNGREAYICGAREVNPDLKTPLLNDQASQRHVQEGKVPIAVYPEVATGNPFNCSVVARFLLNFEGFINGKSMDAAPSDLLFYSGQLIATHHGHPEGDLLCLPTIDIDLFSAPPAGSQRQGCYLYQNRFPLEQIDYAILPADIRLLSMANALTLPELADVLRQAQVLYTHEWSMTCVIAILCGCPVIFIPGHGIDQAFLDASFVGSAGFAMLDQPDAIERARAGVEGALQRYVERTAPFWNQLDVFIAKTQDAACREAIGNRFGVLGWLRQRYPQPRQLQLINEELAGASVPLFAILIRDDGDRAALARTLDSLARSAYSHVQVHVLGCQEPGLAGVSWVACDPEAVGTTVNSVLQSSSCDWMMLVDAGEEFTAGGLLMAALELQQAPAECLALYGDETIRLPQGGIDTALRPDLNLDLLLAFPGALSRHWLYRRESVLADNGFDGSCGAAFELQYQLRLVTARGLHCVGHLSEPLLIANELPMRPCIQEKSVIEAHLRSRGYMQAQAIALDRAPGCYRIDYAHERQASVSVLIYLQGPLLQLQRCLESVLAQTTHGDYEIVLIDPGNDDPAHMQWLDMIEVSGGDRFEVMRFMPGQPRAAMCNAAALDARGEFLAWLDADSAVLDGDWLQVLLNHAQRPEVGAVGCMLLNGDGLVRQAGLVLGLGGTVGRAFEGRRPQDGGYMGRLGLEQNCSAVGRECLVVRRSSFLEVGGFEADTLLAEWVDADLCLKLQRSGYLNVWTPHARVLVDRPASRPATPEEEDALYARWLPQLAHDPAYNSNFSLRPAEGFVIQANELSRRPLQGRVPTVLACTSDAVNAQVRLLEPLQALRKAGKFDGAIVTSLLSPVEVERFAPSSVILHRPVDEPGMLALRRLRAFSQAFKIYDLQQPFLPAITGDYGARELLQRVAGGIMQADRVLVAGAHLAELLQGAHDDVRVLEPLLPASWGRVQGARRAGARPRLGWLEDKDVQLLAEVVPLLAGEVDWIVMGDCPPALLPLVKEVHPRVGYEHLADGLAALNLDIALVPMMDTLANACSGDIRVLQHAACGHAVICSRVPGFAGSEVLPLSRVENSTQDWIRAIRLHLSDLDASAALGDALQAAVRADWLLEGQSLERWRQAWLA